MNLRKTKIICTLGPATDDDEVLRKLMIEGMDVARFNFSHGDHAQHRHEHVVDQRRHNLAKGTAYDHAHGHVDDVALHGKLFKFS